MGGGIESPGLTSIGGMKVHIHLDSALNRDVKQLEEGIDYILSCKGSSKDILRSILCRPGGKEVPAFTHFEKSCFGSLSRERVYFLAVEYLKTIEPQLSKLVRINADSMITWCQRTLDEDLSFSVVATNYISEIGVASRDFGEEKEVRFDAAPYNDSQAKVHIKLAKFNENYWVKGFMFDKEKYVGDNSFPQTISKFPECARMAYLFGVDKLEIVADEAATSFDRFIARKKMFEERVVNDAWSNRVSKGRNTLCKDSFQARFENRSPHYDKLFQQFDVISKMYAYLKPNFEIREIASENFGKLANIIIDGAKVLLQNPRLKCLYADTGTYYHAVTVIYRTVGCDSKGVPNLIKVEIHDPASTSERFYIKFYLRPQDFDNKIRNNQLQAYLFYVPGFFSLIRLDNVADMCLANLVCRVPKAQIGLLDKKYIHNNTLDVAYAALKSELDENAAQLIHQVMTNCDFDLAEKLFSNKDFTVDDLNDDHYHKNGNSYDVVGLFVGKGVFELVQIILEKWNEEYIKYGINKQMVNWQADKVTPLDYATKYLKDPQIVSLLKQYGAKSLDELMDNSNKSVKAEVKSNPASIFNGNFCQTLRSRVFKINQEIGAMAS